MKLSIRISNTTSVANRKIKFTFFCIGPGETSQAISLAKKAKQAGIECSFVVAGIISSRWARNEGFTEVIALRNKPKRVTKGIDQGYNYEEVTKTIERQKPDVLVLCNSKAYSWGFIERKPEAKPLIVSLDSNWLFGQYEDVKMPEWIDRFLVTFPEKVFRAGLKKYGGYYEIEKKYLEKIIPVGFIPSNKISQKEKDKIKNKFKIRKGEKLIFAYTGRGITYRNFILNKIFKSLDFLYKKGYKFKLIYTGDRKIERPWAIFAKEFLSFPRNFNKTLGSSDLAILHQGLITLFQAITNQVPVISNIPPKGKYHSGKYHTSFYEIKTFERLGLCKVLFRNLPHNYLLKEIKNLLGDKKAISKMQKNQEKIFKPGEKKAFDIIIKLLRK